MSERLLAISLDDQHITTSEPGVQFAESVRPGLHLDAKVAPHKRKQTSPENRPPTTPDKRMRAPAKPFPCSARTISRSIRAPLFRDRRPLMLPPVARLTAGRQHHWRARNAWPMRWQSAAG